MEEEGHAHHRDQDRAGQVQGRGRGGDIRPEQPRQGKGGSPQPALHREPREPAQHQEHRQQHVGSPRHPHRNAPVVLIDVGPGFQSAGPAHWPSAPLGEIPGVLRNEKAPACGEDDDREPDRSPEERGKLRPEQPPREHVGDRERGPCEEGEGEDRQPLRPRAVAAEEAGRHDDHQGGHQRAGDGVQNHDPVGDQPQELVHRDAGCEELRVEGISRQAALHPHEHGRAHGPEGHRGTLDHHADHHRPGRREPHRHHERRRHCGRRPESRRALDEGSEEPGDDDDLNPAVLADAAEAAPNRGDAPGLLQRVQQQDRAEDDDQQVKGQKEPLHGRRRDPNRDHLPGHERDDHGRDVGDGHRKLRRHAESNQQGSTDEDREERERGLNAWGHGGLRVESPERTARMWVAASRAGKRGRRLAPRRPG